MQIILQQYSKFIIILKLQDYIYNFFNSFL